MNIKVEDPRSTERLFDALRTRVRGGELVRVTRGDAVALTGMPSEQADPALKSLLKTYRSHLAVTDEGELVYAFDPSFERRDRVPLAERLRAAGAAAWKGFSFLFKIWIVVTLVAYVVAFVAMMIGLTVMGRSDDRNDRRGGGGFGFPWIWYWMMPDLAPRDPYYQRYQRQRRGPQKRFYQSVFDFVFGPKGLPADPKEMEKRLIGFLREHKGRVTASELSALTGLPLDGADEELTRLMAEYNGEVEIAEDGTLIYVFEDLMLSAGQSAAPWSWDFERHERAEPLTGNSGAANAVAGGFAGFNLLASLTVGPAFLERASLHGLGWAASPLALFFVIWFPLMFSFIFFAIPAARWVRSKRKERRRARRELRRQLFAEIWKGAPIDPTRYTGEARKTLEKLLVELDGDVDTDANGRVLYRFPRLSEELRAVENARAEAKPPALGQVIFSSDDAKLH
jgi:hypothetical protein